MASAYTTTASGGRPLPTDGYKLISPRLLKAGFTKAQVDMMTKTNPARLIGLEPWVTPGTRSSAE